LLLPALGLTEHPHYTSDRYDYIPGLAWALVLAGLFWKLSARPALLVAGTACALAGAALCAALSFHQLRIWRSTLSLFEHMVTELGDDPRRDDLRRRLGGFYANQGRADDAIRLYQTSLRLAPSAKTFQAAAELFEKKGDARAALTNYLGWLQLEPTPLAHNRAAAQFVILGDRHEAILHYQQALALRPDFVPTLERLAWLLATSPEDTNRNGAEAVRMAERACARTGNQNPTQLGTLAAAYAESGRFPEAIATARKACELARQAGDAKLEEKEQKLLACFQSGRPFRE
jgi:tetratricopeptide (TPR) repeat protein